MYTEESKYSSKNDNFEFNLTIFYDIYNRASLPPDVRSIAIPTMLRGLALDYYYINIVP